MAKTKLTEIRPLTGLRGVAACFVMLYHFTPDAAGAFLRHGYIAVDLFFMLSGFVMALTYGGEFQFGFSPGVYARFLGKRLGRVYPLYLATLLVCIALLWGEGRLPSGWVLGSNLALIQGWGFADSLNSPGWSISTELAAYLLFPPLTAAVLFSRWRTAWFAAGLSAAVLAVIATLPDAALLEAPPIIRNGPLDVFMPGTPYPLLRCLAGFLLGLLAYRLASVPAVRRLAAREAAGTGLAGLILVALAVQGSDLALAALFVPLLVALAAGRSLAARLLETSPAHWLGNVSYSIYLVHRPVADNLRPPLMRVLDAHGIPHGYSVAGALLAPVALAVATATFHLVEKPGREMSRRLIGRKPPLLRRAEGKPTKPPKMESAPPTSTSNG